MYNCDFTNGRRHHVKGVDSVVRLSSVNVHDSAARASGHGFFCGRCWHVSVEDSNFENLVSEAGRGGAIQIENLFNETLQPVSIIRNNTFKSNTAMSGGALHLDAPHLLEVSGNRFEKNAAESELGESDGGAILYTCNPTQISYTCTVALIDNAFTANKAQRKGGALRYENANFTDVRLVFDTVGNSGSLPELGRRLQAPRNTFEANEAAYGNDLASFPRSI